MSFALWFLLVLDAYNKDLELRHRNLRLFREQLGKLGIFLFLNFQTPCLNQCLALEDQLCLFR